jgi:multidrug resistance efflux pump
MDVRLEQLQLAQIRNSQIYERERLVYLDQLVQNQINSVNLKLAEAELARDSNLFFAKPPLITENAYDITRYKAESLRTNVIEVRKFLEEKARVLPRLLANSTNVLTAVERDIKAQEDKYRSASTNVLLRAPIDGTVGIVNRRPGEKVMAGDPVVVITALQADRIIAYVREPVNRAPKVGEKVTVRRQSFRHEAEKGVVLEVGTHLAKIDPVLLPQNIRQEMGLPFLVSVPHGLKVTPGERVDVIMDSVVRGPAK